MTTRRILDISIRGATVLVADQMLQHCRYETSRQGDQPEDAPIQIVRQAHRVAMSRTPATLKRDGSWENPNPEKWKHLGAE